MHCPIIASESESHPVVSDILLPHGLYSPWNSPGLNTGVVAFPFFRGSTEPRAWTQGSNPGLPHCQTDYLPAEPQGKPRNTGGLAYSFSSRPSRPSNWTRVSWIAGRFFTNWAIREAQMQTWWQMNICTWPNNSEKKILNSEALAVKCKVIHFRNINMPKDK